QESDQVGQLPAAEQSVEAVWHERDRREANVLDARLRQAKGSRFRGAEEEESGRLASDQAGGDPAVVEQDGEGAELGGDVGTGQHDGAKQLALRADEPDARQV